MFHLRGLAIECTSGLLALVTMLSPWVSAQADEGGAAFWMSGSYFFSAAVPDQPGWSIPTQIYYYTGSAGRNERFQRGNTVNLGLSSQLVLASVTPTWDPNTKWLGGQPSLSLTVGGGWNSTSADISISTETGTQTLNRSDSIWGGMDLSPQAQIAWSRGNNNWMTYITGNIPTGAYNSQRLSNIGLGHGAIDAGAAYTYFNPQTGHEFSVTTGLTYNFINPSTKSGRMNRNPSRSPSMANSSIMSATRSGPPTKGMPA